MPAFLAQFRKILTNFFHGLVCACDQGRSDLISNHEVITRELKDEIWIMKHDLFDENLEKEENWKVDLIVTGLIDRVDIFWLYVAQLIQNVFFEDGDMLMTVAYIFIG